MKAIVSALLLCVPLSPLVSSSARAQVGEQVKKEKELERKQQIERKAYVLTEEIENGALSLKLPENRSYVLTAAADLLWEHDEPRARNLFWDALNTLTLMVKPSGNEGSEKGAKVSAKEMAQNQRQYYAIFALRQELLRVVARRDPQLALDMLRSSRQPFIAGVRPSFPVPDDSMLELQIAAEAAARDPQRALQLARESLAKGFSFAMFDMLFRLNQKDATLGTKFAGDIVAKLQTRNLATDQYSAGIAVSLLTYSRTPAESLGPKRPATQPLSLKLDPEQRRELVEKITSAALEGSTEALFALDEVMPEIEEFTPERVAPLQRKLAGFTQTLNQEQKIFQEHSSLMRNGSPEEMLKLAGRASESEREWMQQQAVVMAVTRQRADSLREFVNTEIDDQGRRKTLLDMLDVEQIDNAVYKGDLGQLRKLLPQIRRKEERARAMAEIAIVMEKNGSHDEALKLLDEAQTMIKVELDSDTQTDALLTLVAGYALVEPTRAFGIVERVIDRANDDIAKLLLLDKIAKSGAVKKGEIRLQQSGMMPVDFAVFKYGRAVAALANADFDRTKAAADRFQRPELRLMVRLLLAQALLSGDAPALDNEGQ